MLVDIGIVFDKSVEAVREADSQGGGPIVSKRGVVRLEGVVFVE